MKSFQDIVEEFKKRFEQNPNIQAFLVTGSFARGEAKEGNDLDILVVTNGENINKEYREGQSLIEIGTVVFPRALDNIQNNPMQVYMYLDAKAIFDKDNSLEQLQAKAQEVLINYKPSEEARRAVKKWLSSVVDKVSVAKQNGDIEKVAFHVPNVLWKMVEGLYMINSMPVPASTSALRRISTLKIVPENFKQIWEKILLGNLEERTDNSLSLINFILSKLM